MLKYFFELEGPVLLKISRNPPMVAKKKNIFGFTKVQYVKLEHREKNITNSARS